MSSTLIVGRSIGLLASGLEDQSGLGSSGDAALPVLRTCNGKCCGVCKNGEESKDEDVDWVKVSQEGVGVLSRGEGERLDLRSGQITLRGVTGGGEE